MDYSPPGSSVYGILQARILEWAAIYFSRDLSDPGIEALSPAWQAILYHRATRQLALVCLILIKCLDDYHSESPIYIFINLMYMLG